MAKSEDDSSKRLSKLNTGLGVAGGLIAVLGFLGIANWKDISGVWKSDSVTPATSSNISPVSATPAPSSVSAAKPRMWIKPDVVTVGSGFTINGDGFLPGTTVTIVWDPGMQVLSYAGVDKN